MKIYLIVVMCIICTGCTKIIFMTANAPTLAFDGEIISDVSYGSEKRHMLDIYIPEEATQRPLPVVVFFHGGRWTFGDKEQYKFVGMSLAKLGYIAVLPNTRLYPEVKFPTFVHDGAKAISWVYHNIQKYKGSYDLFVAGHSSGAHIGALITANEKYLEEEGLSNQIINAFAGMAGPYDFTPKDKELKKIFGPPSNYANMAVTTFIEGNEAPMLLLYSQNDKTVHIQNLERLESTIKAKEGKVQSIIYSKGEHAGTVAAYSWANPANLSVKQDIDDFFRRYIHNTHTVALQ